MNILGAWIEKGLVLQTKAQEYIKNWRQARTDLADNITESLRNRTLSIKEFLARRFRFKEVAVSPQELEFLKQKLEALSQASMQLGQAAYQAAQQAEQQQESQNESPTDKQEEKKDEKVVDAEFEDVDK